MKKIFIIAREMESGGTEVSLINLLNELVKNKDVSITLGLLRKKGMYLKDIPDQVEVKEILNKKQLWCLEPMQTKDFKLGELFSAFLFKLFIKLFRRKKLEKYKEILKGIKEQKAIYDIAIDYHGYGFIGTCYVIDKIKAKKKITFVHDEKIDWMAKVEPYIAKYDKIYCVSEACKQRVLERYPKYEEKLDIFRNIINKGKIIKLSKDKISEMNEDCPKLLTVGRLEYQKGYDLLLDVAEILMKNNHEFKWYIIGNGSLYQSIKKEIEERKLLDKVILLGVKKNPYPYFAKCDIYIQTSRHEGYGIAIAEARILEKPIISTDLSCIREQIKNGENGLLCNFDKIEFYNTIKDLMADKKLREKLIENLKKDNKESSNDIKKLLEV